MAGIVGSEILKKAEILSLHPLLGRPVQGRREQHEVVLQILSATYVDRYDAVPDVLQGWFVPARAVKSAFCLSMIFSENRCPLFGIML
jgi:hypothetical protein